MDKEAVEHMHETVGSVGGVADMANCPRMEEEARSARPGKYRI